MYRLTLLVAVAATSGCAIFGNGGKTTAFIDDGRTSNGFKIVAVDGKPPKRWSHPELTVAPFVLVAPGKHTFTIDGNEKPFTIVVEQAKGYRTELHDGEPTLVELAGSSEPHQH